MDGENGDETESVQDAAEERQHERAERVEETLSTLRDDLGEQKYPMTSGELAAMYADQPIDLPNETEWVETALDRIDNSFEDEQAAYEALVTVFEEGLHTGIRSDAKGPEPPYWEEERAETQHEMQADPDDAGAYESSVEQSKERAREAMADSEDEASGEET